MSDQFAVELLAKNRYH